MLISHSVADYIDKDEFAIACHIDICLIDKKYFSLEFTLNFSHFFFILKRMIVIKPLTTAVSFRARIPSKNVKKGSFIASKIEGKFETYF